MLGIQHGHLDITRHVTPNQARCVPEYFLALMEDGLTLFNLTGQCFQDVGLTKWNKVVGSYALTIPTLQKQVSKSEPWTTCGSHQIVQHRQPTDLLALHCKEACIHVIHEFMQ
jgi:hypothetical protein